MVSGTTTGKGGTTLHSLLELGSGADSTGVGTAKTARVRFDAKVSITTRTEGDEPFILLRASHMLPVHAMPVIGVLVEERDEVKGVLAHLEERRPERVVIRNVFQSSLSAGNAAGTPIGSALPSHVGQERERLRIEGSGRSVLVDVWDQVPQAECIFLGKWLSVCTA